MVDQFRSGLGWLRGLLRTGLDTPLPVRVLPAGGLAGAPKLRLIIIGDEAGATLQINLLRPLRAALLAGTCRIYLITEADERAWRRGGGQDGRAVLEALWHDARPTAVFVSRYGGRLAAEIAAVGRRHATPLV
jgi:hypothetical protein